MAILLDNKRSARRLMPPLKRADLTAKTAGRALGTFIAVCDRCARNAALWILKSEQGVLIGPNFKLVRGI